MQNIVLSIVTPEKVVLDSKLVKEILIPGATGEVGILPGHAPMVSALGTGVLKYWLVGSNKPEAIAVSWGYLEALGEKVVVLAESAETKKAIDKDKSQQKLKQIAKQLEDPSLSPKQIRTLRKEEQKQQSFLKLLE